MSAAAAILRASVAAPPAPMTLEIRSDLDVLEAEWDALAERTASEPFVRPGWIRAWSDAFGSGALELLCVRRRGRLVAGVPLESDGAVLRSPSNWHTPSFAPIAEDTQALRELVEAVFGRRERRIVFAFVPDDVEAAGALCEAALGAGRRVLVRTLQRSPRVTIDGDWEAYANGLSRNHTADIRRRWRGLERQGEVTIEISSGEDRLDELLAEGFRIEGSGWKLESQTAIESRAETRAFYTKIARWAATRQLLVLSFLRLEGRALAFQLCLETPEAHYFLKGGYDPAFSHYSPGKLLHHAMVKRAFGAGLLRYEFLGDEEPYKAQWARDARSLVLVQAFANTPAGVVDWAAQARARPALRWGFEIARAIKRRLGR